MKRILIVLAVLMATSLAVFAADSFSSFDNAGNSAQNVAVSGIKSWKWIIGFMPFAFGIYSAIKVNEYLNQKDESGQGQNEPKATRYVKVLGAGIFGILIIYILLGLIGTVFADKSFSETWQTFVVDLWSQIFS